ncbi:30S ribosomal protein S16 [Candidatus Margulisiibacteriota bacterium]
MAVKIRLKRIGAKKAPIYRVVVMEAKQPRDGRVIDMVGRYNPRTNPITLELDKEKAAKWLSCGAVPTDVVGRLLSYAGLIGKAEEKTKPKKSSTKQTKPEKEVSKATEA